METTPKTLKTTIRSFSGLQTDPVYENQDTNIKDYDAIEV